MICKEPFSCLNIQGKSISSCCLMPTWKVDIIDFDNDATLNSIRNEILLGKWPTSCNACKVTEEKGLKSRRQAVESWYTENAVSAGKLTRIDYWCGNLCNLRCAICSPEFSVAWQKELGIQKEERTVVTSDEWKKIDLSELRWIHFNGGEPLLILEHMALLKSIPYPKKVHLNYNTNGTVRPTQELISTWENFKIVQLDFSIDGIGDRFEYMRYPANWNIVKENLFWFRDTMPVNMLFDVNATVSILNQNSIDKTENWFATNYNKNRLGDPITFRKQYAYGSLAIGNDKVKALEYLDTLDKRRGTNWRQTFPELIDP